MGEILNWRGFKIFIEDTTATNPREAEHIHFYYEGVRYRAFIDRRNCCFSIKDDDYVNKRIIKNVLKLIDNNYEFIVQQYDAAKEGKKVLRVKLN